MTMKRTRPSVNDTGLIKPSPIHPYRLFVKVCAMLLVALLQGCAINRDGASVTPDLDTSSLSQIYVVRSSQDQHGVDVAIAERLRQMGRTVSTGTAEAVPATADAVLSYQAQWQWDVKMYLLELRMALRAPKTNALLASAASYHTSLSRKSTEEMVNEVLHNIFVDRPEASKKSSGITGNATVQLEPFVALREAKTANGIAVHMDLLRDTRDDAVGALIGERKTFNKAMGMIYLSPPPVQAVTDMLRSELTAAGYRFGQVDAPTHVSGRLIKFEVDTPNTALYWDINGKIEIELSVEGQAGPRHEARYQTQCTDRTYNWPSEAKIAGVLQSCLEALGEKVRADRALANALGAG